MRTGETTPQQTQFSWLPSWGCFNGSFRFLLVSWFVNRLDTMVWEVAPPSIKRGLTGAAVLHGREGGIRGSPFPQARERGDLCRGPLAQGGGQIRPRALQPWHYGPIDGQIGWQFSQNFVFITRPSTLSCHQTISTWLHFGLLNCFSEF